ncbi:MAG: flagellar hook-associated protein FlgL [Bacillota bacterium]
MLRVSNIMMSNNMCNYIQNNLQRSAKSQEQISTGKTIIRPSDNPTEISHLMSVNATLIGNEQYARNIQDGLAYLEQSDSALDTIGKFFHDAKILALQGANGTLTKEDMQAIGEQIDKQIDALVDLGNSSLGGKYLFAGTKNGQPPFERVKDAGKDIIYYRGNTDLVRREVIFGFDYEVVTPGVTENTSVKSGVFGKLTDAADPDYQIDDPMNPGPPAEKMTKITGGPFDVLYELKNYLNNGDSAGVNVCLGKLDSAHQDILTHRVGVGARTRHLEAVKDQLADQEVKLRGVLVDIQGADIAKLTVEVAQNQLVHQASLMTASKLLSTSLLQFLK